MRIRELIFNNVRAFRGEHRISFVDQLTDQASPISVIAGTNGTGKTTILEAIMALLQFAVTLEIPPGSLLAEVANDGFASLTLELSASDISEDESSETQTLQLMVGKRELAPHELPPQSLYCLSIFPQPVFAIPRIGSDLPIRQRLVSKIAKMQTAETALRGGLLYFPQTRALASLEHDAGVSVQEQPYPREWLAHLTPPTQWQGSLEALWVWQNYLDLEAGASNGNHSNGNHSNLHPFVESVEEALGDHRQIIIRQARVLVQADWQNNGEPAWVRLNQLPSGEQQLLFLLGELARHRRPGAVIAIDEPETSLHPSLQRMLVYKLMKLASAWDCQLILATHSLEIMRSVHASRLINLDHLDRYERHLKAYAEAAA